MITIEREHEICCGHRVVGHEGKCRHLHGHNYKFVFTIEAPELDDVGRIVDFSIVKETLCQWLEDNWDHKFLAWQKDPLINRICQSYHMCKSDDKLDVGIFHQSFLFVPFNPTAENMASYLLEEVGPLVLPSCVRLVKVKINETSKCSAIAEL